MRKEVRLNRQARVLALHHRLTEPGGIFKTVLIAANELELRSIVDEMRKRAIELLGGSDYDSAAQTLRDLFGIQVIENDHVTSLLAKVKEDVRALALKLHFAALDSVMLEDELSTLCKGTGSSTSSEASISFATCVLSK